MSLIDVIGQAYIKSGEKSAAKREAKEKKREAQTAEWIANVKAVQDWEHALTYVIAAKASGTEAPEWAVKYIDHDLHKATAILHEAEKNAHLSHVTTDKNSADYNKELAELTPQNKTIHSKGAVENRLNVLATIFRAKTNDVRYRETLIKTIVSYSIHKAKVLSH